MALLPMEAVVPEPLFSVVVPAYNAGAFLSDALRSVVQQVADLPCEIIVVDDGSTDDSAAIAGAHPGVRLLRQDNAGPARARNRGIAAARAELIFFLDADDRSEPGRFDRQARYMLANPSIDLSFGNWRVENEPGSYLRRYGLEGPPDRFVELEAPLARLLADGCFVPTSTVAARRSALLSAGGFPEDRRYAEDYALWLRLAAAGRFAFLDAPLAWYRTASPGRLTLSDDTYLGLVMTLREALAAYGASLDAAAGAKAAGRYAAAVNALLRHDWAYGGRQRVRDRMIALEPFLPEELRRKYWLASFVPAAVPRTARHLLHRASRLAQGT
jgi:glycosyltransferase involved in cell wall biosynthesis